MMVYRTYLGDRAEAVPDENLIDERTVAESDEWQHWFQVNAVTALVDPTVKVVRRQADGIAAPYPRPRLCSDYPTKWVDYSPSPFRFVVRMEGHHGHRAWEAGMDCSVVHTSQRTPDQLNNPGCGLHRIYPVCNENARAVL